MSSEQPFEFTKENIDLYLKELSKEYRKMVGKAMPAELILIGGASVLINYGFRNMTTDIDAVIRAASAMKDAISRVGDRFCLPKDWLNTDFTKTDSFSPKLEEVCKHYRTFSNSVSVWTISEEYLIAMKLRSGRQYKSDLSDVIGILYEHQKRGDPIRMDEIKNAVADLYGNWDVLPETSQAFIENVMRSERLSQLYAETVSAETETKDLLIQFERDYPGRMKGTNVDAIAGELQKKTDRASILAQLRKRQQTMESGQPSVRKQNRDDIER